MPQKKDRFDQMRTATQLKIRKAATKLFSTRGVASTSVQQIADMAGISTGLLYRHYASKNELFAALVTEASAILQDITDRLTVPGEPVNIMKDLSDEILNNLGHNDEYVQHISVISQAFMMDALLPQIQDLLERNRIMIEQTAALIAKGQALGQFVQGDAYEMSLFFYAAAQGLTDLRFALKDRFRTPSPAIFYGFLIPKEN